jgi:hypothetical protein
MWHRCASKIKFKINISFSLMYSNETFYIKALEYKEYSAVDLWKILKSLEDIQVRDEPIPEKSRFADPIYQSRYKKIIGRLIGYGRYFCVEVE